MTLGGDTLSKNLKCEEHLICSTLDSVQLWVATQSSHFHVLCVLSFRGLKCLFPITKNMEATW
jgi:hypothetical protein